MSSPDQLPACPRCGNPKPLYRASVPELVCDRCHRGVPPEKSCKGLSGPDMDHDRATREAEQALAANIMRVKDRE